MVNERNSSHYNEKAFSYNSEKGTTDPIREYILIVEQSECVINLTLYIDYYTILLFRMATNSHLTKPKQNSKKQQQRLARDFVKQTKRFEI